MSQRISKRKGFEVTLKNRDANPALAYLSGLSQGSQATAYSSLNAVANALSGGSCDLASYPWSTLTAAHVDQLRDLLKQHYKAATANKILALTRGVIRKAYLMDQVSTDTLLRVKEVKGVKGDPLPTGRSISNAEFRELMKSCLSDESPAGMRDAALFAILKVTGIRREELVGLKLTDYSETEHSLKIRGKGNKERLVYVGNGAESVLIDWLTIRGSEGEFAFVPINKSGVIDTTGSLSTTAMHKILNKRAEAAGIEGITIHDFRRTFVGELLDLGEDIVTVQKLAGHANINTTARYDRRPEAVKRVAASKLFVPYKRPNWINQ